MLRRVFVWLHRWTGLLLAAFLIIEGLTGSLLAFNNDLTRFFNPALFAAPPGPDAMPLDLAALAERAEARIPQARVDYFNVGTQGQVLLRCSPRKDPATGKPYAIGFKYLVLDPWTGKELGRVHERHSSQGFIPNIMPFVYMLHEALALGGTGAWVLVSWRSSGPSIASPASISLCPWRSKISGGAGSLPGSSNGRPASFASISICTGRAGCGSGQCFSSSPGRARCLSRSRSMIG